MGKYIKPPKILSWKKTLNQSHQSKKKILITGGASFTTGTNQLNCASSWPGYLYERCRFKRVIDMSYPGIGNQEIANLIVNELNVLSDINSVMVIVMWNSHDVTDGLDWDDIETSSASIVLDKKESKQRAQLTYDVICKLSEYLDEKNIPYAFTFSFNVLYPPFIHRRDANCNLRGYLPEQAIKDIENQNFFPLDQKQFLYDFAFYNDMFDEDMYHPNLNCRLKWTDEVLLPNLEKLGLVTKIIK